MYFKIKSRVIRYKCIVGYIIKDKYIENFIDQHTALNAINDGLISNAIIKNNKIYLKSKDIKNININEAEDIVNNNINNLKYGYEYYKINSYARTGKILIKALDIEPSIEYKRGKIKGFKISDGLYMTENGIIYIDENNNMHNLRYIVDNLTDNEIEDIFNILNENKNNIISKPYKMSEKYNKFGNTEYKFKDTSMENKIRAAKKLYNKNNLKNKLEDIDKNRTKIGIALEKNIYKIYKKIKSIKNNNIK